MDPSKKISFGFSNQSKKPALLRQPTPPKVELVECLEGQSVKVKDTVEKVHKPLVIPIKEDRKGIVDRIKQARAKQLNEANAKNQELEDKPDSELSLEELAARELLNDAKKRLEQHNNPEGKVLVLPNKEEKVAVQGEPEPTLEDYENIPISDYGLAMLRGMGWKEGMGIGKKNVKINLTKPPDVRPKGLGLGATRVIHDETLKAKAVEKDGKQLILVKGAFAKIIAGSNKGSYCKILGLDEEASRVIVKTSKETILSLNEFMLVPVGEEEYTRNSKVLNRAKYEEYKDKINKKEPNSVSDLGTQTSSNQTKESTSRSHLSYGENSSQYRSIKQEKPAAYKGRENSQEKSKHKSEKISEKDSSGSDKELRKDNRNQRSWKQEKYIKEKYCNQDNSSDRKEKRRSRSRIDSSISSNDSEEVVIKGRSKSHKSKSKKTEVDSDSNDDRKNCRSQKLKNIEKQRNDSSSDSKSEKKIKHHKKKDKRSHKDRSRSPRRKHSKKNSDHRRPSSSDSEYEHRRSKK